MRLTLWMGHASNLGACTLVVTHQAMRSGEAELERGSRGALSLLLGLIAVRLLFSCLFLGA